MNRNWTKLSKTVNGRGPAQWPNDDKPCIFVYARGDVKLSIRAFELLGRPSFVEVFSDGNGFLGFRGATSSTGNYVVSSIKNKGNGKTGNDPRRVACKLISKQYRLVPQNQGGLVCYMGTFEQGMLVIDTHQVPDKIR